MTPLDRARRDYGAWYTENRMTGSGMPWVRERLAEARETLAALEGITPAELASQRRCEWCGKPSTRALCPEGC